MKIPRHITLFVQHAKRKERTKRWHTTERKVLFWSACAAAHDERSVLPGRGQAGALSWVTVGIMNARIRTPRKATTTNEIDF